MPPLERFILHRLFTLDGHVRAAYEAYAFADALRPVSEFCAGELSSLYFDVRKDCLYCDNPHDAKRRAARTVMTLTFERLTAWLAPIAPFTTEEAWSHRAPGEEANAFRRLPDPVDAWRDDEEADRFAAVQASLAAVTARLEEVRREKLIGAALEAHVVLEGPAPVIAAYEGLDPAEIFRTSTAELRQTQAPGDGEISVRVFKAEGGKCERCWRVLSEVGPSAPLCRRCEAVVSAWDAAAK
jgi:isoleucyl-tRNA synthetase